MSKLEVKYIRAVKATLNGVPDADAIVLGYTMGRTSHVSEMTIAEATQLLKDKNKGSDEKRKKILAICYDIKRVTPDGKPDLEWLDEWCKKYGPVKKAFNKYTSAELSKMIIAFENMRKTTYQGL